MNPYPAISKAFADEAPHALGMDRDGFLYIAAGLETHVTEADRALRIVYGVLREAVSAGQIAELEATVPKPIGAYLRQSKRA